MCNSQEVGLMFVMDVFVNATSAWVFEVDLNEGKLKLTWHIALTKQKKITDLNAQWNNIQWSAIVQNFETKFDCNYSAVTVMGLLNLLFSLDLGDVMCTGVKEILGKRKDLAIFL